MVTGKLLVKLINSFLLKLDAQLRACNSQSLGAIVVVTNCAASIAELCLLVNGPL